MEQIVRALATRRSSREDWSRALRYFNPTTFDECGCVSEASPQAAYIPTEREVRDLRYFGPPDQSAAAPPLPATSEEPAFCPVSLAELAAGSPPVGTAPQPMSPASTDWAGYTPEQRDAAMLAFAVRGGLELDEVSWNDQLGPNLQIGGVGLASGRVGLEDLPAEIPNHQLWQVIRAQGGLSGVVVTGEMRRSPRYRDLQQQEFLRLQLELGLRAIDTSMPVQTAPGAVLDNTISLLENGTTARPRGTDVHAMLVQRTDDRFVYEIALEHLGRPVALPPRELSDGAE